MIAELLSARTGGLQFWRLAFQRGDDLLEVGGDLPVHLRDAFLAAGLGGGDDLQGLLVMLAMAGKELGGGEEHRARQARVGVRARLLYPQPAVAVGECLGGAADPLFRPRGGGQRPPGRNGGWFAAGLDLTGL